MVKRTLIQNKGPTLLKPPKSILPAVFLRPYTQCIPTVFQTHRKTVLNHLGWVLLPSKDLTMETALHRVNGKGIPNDIMPEAFGSIVMFATNMDATIEHCTKAFNT